MGLLHQLATKVSRTLTQWRSAENSVQLFQLTPDMWKIVNHSSESLSMNLAQTAESMSLSYPPPPFPSPPKLLPVSEVLKEHPGTNVASLRELTIALAKDSIFGREELCRCSLSGCKNTASLDVKKLDYI